MGYILINAHGQRLTSHYHWSGISQGWIWTEEEMKSTLATCYDWTFKPTHAQRARLDKNQVVPLGQPFELTKIPVS